MSGVPGPRRVAVSAHQGGSETAPGGTIEAYRSSLDTGAEYVEFDIRHTADGEPVVFHDDHVSGPHGNRAVDRLTRAELSDLAGFPVPLVSDVMELIAGRALGHLDLKGVGRESDVISLAIGVLGVDNFVATTLEDVSVARIKQRFPAVRTALSLGRDLDGHPWPRRVLTRRSELFPLRRIRACGADWVAVHQRLADATVLAICARHGIGAMVWTVNEAPAIDRFVTDPRVSVLVTDRPELAVRRRATLAAG
jgi:glycerophosphoryl diester phosphodiesterase